MNTKILKIEKLNNFGYCNVCGENNLSEIMKYINLVLAEMIMLTKFICVRNA